MTTSSRRPCLDFSEGSHCSPFFASTKFVCQATQSNTKLMKQYFIATHVYQPMIYRYFLASKCIVWSFLRTTCNKGQPTLPRAPVIMYIILYADSCSKAKKDATKKCIRIFNEASNFFLTKTKKFSRRPTVFHSINSNILILDKTAYQISMRRCATT